MPSKRQRKARAAAAQKAAAVAATNSAQEVRSPDPKSEGSDDGELRILEDREDGVLLAVRPVQGAVSQWISWRYAPIGKSMGEWQGQSHDRTGKAVRIFVPFKRVRGAMYEFYRGYTTADGEHRFRGEVMGVGGLIEIKSRGTKSTGVAGPGAEDPGAERKPRPRSVGTGAQALEQGRSSRGTLEEDLGGRERKPKPRNVGYIDEQVWLGAMEAARGQVRQDYCIPECLNAYYVKMCKPGQLLLADELHRRAQIIYDYRAGKAIYRENRRQK